jgi:hypothetical protein
MAVVGVNVIRAAASVMIGVARLTPVLIMSASSGTRDHTHRMARILFAYQ